MAVLAREDLRKQFIKQEISRVYLFFGAEDFLRDEWIRAISNRVLKDSPLREFNEAEFSLNETDIRSALATAEQLPMMGEKRVVKVTEVQKIREEDEASLARYLADPAESCVLILVAGDLDKRKRVSKLLLEKTFAVEFSELRDGELAAWAKGQVKNLSAKADDRTIAYLVGLVGNNVRKLSSELEKIAVASLPEGVISIELIDKLVSNSRELSNFALTDYLLSKNRPRAMQTLKKVLDDGAEPLMLLGLIANNYHRVALVKDMMRKGYDSKEVFKAVMMPFSKQEEFKAIARRADAEALDKILERIAAADLAIKTSQATPRMQIEMLVYELTA